MFPVLGAKPVNQITAPELLAVLRRIEGRGAIDTAHRTLQDCSRIFRYAVATGRGERDPAADLKGALPPARSTSFLCGSLSSHRESFCCSSVQVGQRSRMGRKKLVGGRCLACLHKAFSVFIILSNSPGL